MDKETYKINVAYKGMHDFTVTVDRNGPDNTTERHADFVFKTLKRGLPDSYNLTMTKKTTAIKYELIS